MTKFSNIDQLSEQNTHTHTQKTNIPKQNMHGQLKHLLKSIHTYWLWSFIYYWVINLLKKSFEPIGICPRVSDQTDRMIPS